jgi:hypothetical protein
LNLGRDLCDIIAQHIGYVDDYNFDYYVFCMLRDTFHVMFCRYRLYLSIYLKEEKFTLANLLLAKDHWSTFTKLLGKKLPFEIFTFISPS